MNISEAHPKKHFFFLISLIISCWPTLSRSADILIGVGPTYSQSQIRNSANTGDSFFRGVGYSLNVALRMPPARDMHEFSFVLLGTFDQSNLTNVNTTSTELNQTTQYGAELQLWFNQVFVGAKYVLASSQISSSTLTSQVSSTGFGPLAGYGIPLFDSFSMRLEMILLTGTVTQYSGSLMLQYRFATLFDDGDSRGKR